MKTIARSLSLICLLSMPVIQADRLDNALFVSSIGVGLTQLAGIKAIIKRDKYKLDHVGAILANGRIQAKLALVALSGFSSYKAFTLMKSSAQPVQPCKCPGQAQNKLSGTTNNTLSSPSALTSSSTASTTTTATTANVTSSTTDSATLETKRKTIN